MHQRRFHRGSVYLTVLSVSMIVSVIGVGALLAVRQQRLASDMADDADSARVAARSGIDIARYLIASDASWRTTHTSGTWQTISFRNRQAGIDVTDPGDGTLSNCYSDPVLVTSTGLSGSAQQIMQVTLAPELKPLGCLAAALTVNGGLAVKGGGINSDGLVACNGTISGGGPLNANAEAFAITNLNLNGSGTRTIVNTARAVPASTVFDYYVAFGTPISYDANSGNFKQITLSPTRNPYGATNPRGIYYCDCQGKTATLEDLTINGTLVLLNCKNDTQIKGAPSFAGLSANQPTLLVDGSLIINVDKYPVSLNGPIYVSGALTVSSNASINDPLIVGGSCTINGALTINYDPAPFNAAPEGFYQLPCNMRPVSGSWKPAVN
jgi:hypothetical protein